MSGQDGAGVNGGPAAVAPYVGDAIYLSPLAGGIDNGPQLQSTINLYAGRRRVVLLPGVWNIATSVIVANNSRILVSKGASFTSTLPSGAFTGFIFYKFAATTALGVLSAAPTPGDSTLSVSVAPTVGQWIWVGQVISPFLAARYQVISVAGGGPFTVTLDRPCMFPFVIGESVRNLTDSPENIEIDFNHAPITGNGDRIFEFTGGLDVTVKNCLYTPTAGAGQFNVLGSMDIGSYRCRIEDCYGRFHGVVSGSGWLLESADKCHIIRSGVDLATNGITVFDSVNFSVVDCYAGDATNSGLLLTSNLATIGCFSGDVRGGYFNGGANLGVGIAYATDVTLTNVRAERNLINYDIGSGATPSTRLRLDGCLSARSTSRGTRINAAAIDTKLIGYASLADVYAVATFGQVAMYECDFINYTSGGLLIDATVGANAPVTFSGGRVASNVSGSLGCDKYGPCQLVFENMRFDMNTVAANSSCIFDRAAALGCTVLRNCTGTQASACNGYYTFGGGNTGRIEGRTDFQAFAAPYTITAGSYINRFAIVLNPGAALVVGFPDLKVNEAPKLTRTAVAGGTGLAPVIAPITPGTGFTATAAALDGDTYQVEIGS